MPKKHRSRKRNKARRRNDPKSELARNSALEVLSLMRTKGLSLAKAAKQAHTTPKTVVRYAGAALRKEPSGKYQASPFDRLARFLRFLTPEGQIHITVRSSRTATKVSEYMAAVDHYLKTGDTARLAQFRGKSVRVGTLKFQFVTDPRILDRLAHAGEVAFEDLYAISR